MGVVLAKQKQDLSVLSKYGTWVNLGGRCQILSEERWNGILPFLNKGSFRTKLCQKRGTFTPKSRATPLDWRVPFCLRPVQIPQKGAYFELNYAKKGGTFTPKSRATPLIDGPRLVYFLYEFLKKGPILN
jgi:hypothetical protein